MKTTDNFDSIDENKLINAVPETKKGVGDFGTFDNHEMDGRPAGKLGRSRTTLKNDRLRKFIEQENVCMKVRSGEKVTKKTTDCYGDIEFKETINRSTGKFVRFSDDTDPATVFQLLTEQWGVQPPRLLISVTGGAKSLDIPIKLKNDFQQGLRKVANTPGAWVISGGTNTGVMKMVGDVNFGQKNTCIGIAPWGVVAKKETLDPQNTMLDRQFSSASQQQEAKQQKLAGVFPYHLGSYLFEKGVFLDANHTHFLLVDNGSENVYGTEIEFRGKFEEHIMRSMVPTVLIVLEGGPGTLNTVFNTAVSNDIPCVLVQGSGRAADLLVYAINNWETILDAGDSKDENLIKEIYSMNPDFTDEKLAEHYETVLKCVKKREIFTIANYEASEYYGEAGMDCDDAILTALLKGNSKSLSHYEQLQFAILWDREDLAQTKILSPMTKWIPMDGSDGCDGEGKKELDRLMIMALALNRTKLVKLLLDYGVSIKSLLTKQVLEFLYWFCASTLMGYDDRATEPIDGWEDDGDFLHSLLSYSSGSRRTEVKKVPLVEVKKRLSNLLTSLPASHLDKMVEIPEGENDTFDNPFQQLFIWAVLNNHLEMAMQVWHFEDDGIALALLASEISKGLTNNSRFYLLSDEEERNIQTCLSTFTALSIEMLDECYKTCEKNTALLITDRLDLFNNRMCCIEFAFATQQMTFVAHTAVQTMLDRIWYGSIKSCDTSAMTVFATIFCPLLLIDMDIQSQTQMAESSRYNAEDCSPEDKDEDDLLDAAEDDDGTLPFYQKFYNFHVHSPLVKFIEHTIGYIAFLMLFSFVAMCEIKSTTPGVWESIVIATTFGYFVSELYQLVHVDGSVSGLARLRSYLWDFWNLFDLLCIVVFVVAVKLRCFESTMEMGQLFYAVDLSLWWVRLIQIMYAHPTTGPYVVMIGEMLSDMFSFLIILFIFLLSYGIAFTAILQPGAPSGVRMLVQPLFKPYFNIYGEYFIDAPEDGKTWFGTKKTNDYAEPIAFVYLAVYLLIANVLLLNLLIAIFGNTFGKVMDSASTIWKFQRYSLIVEYAERSTFLCPPLSLVQHVVFFVHWMLSLCSPHISPPRIEKGLQPKQVIGKGKRKEIRAMENTSSIQIQTRSRAATLAAE